MPPASDPSPAVPRLALGLDVDGTLLDRAASLTGQVRGRSTGRVLADLLAAGIPMAIITGNDLELQRRRLAPLLTTAVADGAADRLYVYADGGTRLMQLRPDSTDGALYEIESYRDGHWPGGRGDTPRSRHDLDDAELDSLRTAWSAACAALPAETADEREPRVVVRDRRIEIGPMIDRPDASGGSLLALQLVALRERFDGHRVPVEIGFDGRWLHIEWVGVEREAIIRVLLALADDAPLPRRVQLDGEWWPELTEPRFEVRGSEGFASQCAIRPFKRHRRVFLAELRRQLVGAGLDAVFASAGGETTIDLQRTGTTKATAIRDFALRLGVAEPAITYIANEFHESGNDRVVALQTDARCLNVGPSQPDLLGVTTIGDGWRATWEHLFSLSEALRSTGAIGGLTGA